MAEQGEWKTIPQLKGTLNALPRITVDFDATVMTPEAAECLEMVMDEVARDVDQLFGVDPQAVGRVTIRVFRGEWFFEGNMGGSASGISIYTTDDISTSDILQPVMRFALALEYARVVLERSCSGGPPPFAGNLYSGIAVAVADLVCPDSGFFPVRDPHQVSAGLLMLDGLHVPEPTDPWIYSFAVAGSFCKYLIERFGAGKILRVYSKLKSGVSIDEAMVLVYGEQPKIVEEGWRSLLRRIAEEDPDRVRAMAEVMIRLSQGIQRWAGGSVLCRPDGTRPPGADRGSLALIGCGVDGDVRGTPWGDLHHPCL